ncbi:ATP-dependent Clp protease adapter ClpS [Pseudarthrobacter sp. J1738]|uniref:ATP-dependent Clp protease adapter ClpS n=1 Tax=unclassified Pseudarthrobacter TaxID=2647000 RepID=UPI003D2A1A78
MSTRHRAAVLLPRAAVTVKPRTEEHRQTEELAATDTPWNLVIWDDPVNLMSYVSYVFQSYFGFSESKANKLMLEVHRKGRAIVAHGAKEQVERHVVAMHGFGLWATVEQAGGSQGNGGQRG